MTTSEIAAEHGVSRQTVHAHRKRGVFPKPVEGEGSTRPRFRADEVAAFFAANPPTPGKRTDLPARQQGEPAVNEGRMSDLIEWYGAQLDEEEQRARACPGNGEWDADGIGFFAPDLNSEAQAHIVEHDPARVLREIEAKRDLLRFAEGIHDHHETFMNGTYSRLEGTLRLFAAAYADRPGYREEWRP